MIKYLIPLLLFSSLSALQKEPWLGNWLECVASLNESRTQSSTVNTASGKKHDRLYADRTIATIEFTPLIDLATALELGLSKTQSKPYGFENVKASCRYRILDDLVSDPVSLTTGVVCALSTPRRVKGLSSCAHGVFETEGHFALGREFWQHARSYYQAWLLGFGGIASSGSPWVGFEAHLGRVIHQKHYFDLFFRFNKGLSSHKLHRLSNFHSWSRIGYEFEELGIGYRLKEIALGSCYIEATTRILARSCPSNVWSVKVGLVLPFSPW